MAFPGSLAKPMNPENLNGVDDNTQLMHLHEPSLLFNLCPTHGLQAPAPAQPPEGGASMGARRHRYAKDLIYTYTGYILIAVNPYKKLACYGAARGAQRSQLYPSATERPLCACGPLRRRRGDEGVPRQVDWAAAAALVCDGRPCVSIYEGGPRASALLPFPSPPRHAACRLSAGRRYLAVHHDFWRIWLRQDRERKDCDEVSGHVRSAKGARRASPPGPTARAF